MLWKDAFPNFLAPVSQHRLVTIPTSSVKRGAETNVTYWQWRKAINVSVEISTLEAKKWTTVSAPLDAKYGQPAMDRKPAVVDQVLILWALLATLMLRNKYFVD